jgi:hypothetical protein
MPNISNISLNTSEALLPTAYSLQQVTFTNHFGRQFDLRALVTEMSITESLYTPSLVLSLDVKDPVNTLEEFQMTGQETIKVVLARKPYGSYEEETVDVNFVVTEYPIFGRFGDRLQVYSLRGVTLPAYSSELKKISRAFKGDLRDFIRGVLTKDLGIPSDGMVISSKPTSQVSLVVPNMAPIDAIYWALRRCYDETGAPFYFFQRLDGKYCLLSHSELVAQDSYREYRDAKFFQYSQSGDTDRQKDYDERARRILSLASDARMSKYGSIPNGAYASRTDYLDLSTKTLLRDKFDYSASFKAMNWIDSNPVVSAKFRPDAQRDPLTGFDQSKINYISKNSYAYADGSNYHSPTEGARINRAQSYVENMDNISHDLTLSGDFKLHAGQMVSLSIPPAIDPEARAKNDQSVNDIKRDSFFSGKYLVTAAVHRFGPKYLVDLKIKRDTLAFKLS